MQVAEPNALQIPGLITGAKLQRRLEHKTRHDAIKQLTKYLGSTSYGLRATNTQLKAGAKTLFAMAKEKA